MEQLPIEILHLIFSFVDRKSLLSTRLACQTWYCIASEKGDFVDSYVHGRCFQFLKDNNYNHIFPLKTSLIEFTKNTFPEDFNDFLEYPLPYDISTCFFELGYINYSSDMQKELCPKCEKKPLDCSCLCSKDPSHTIDACRCQETNWSQDHVNSQGLQIVPILLSKRTVWWHEY